MFCPGMRQITYCEFVAVAVVVNCRDSDVGGVFSRKSKADCGSAVVASRYEWLKRWSHDGPTLN
jgi:hypothetical protein